jgi:hypothetical protein
MAKVIFKAFECENPLGRNNDNNINNINNNNNDNNLLKPRTLRSYGHCMFKEIRSKKVFVIQSLWFSAASLRLTTLRISRGKWAKRLP